MSSLSQTALSWARATGRWVGNFALGAGIIFGIGAMYEVNKIWFPAPKPQRSEWDLCIEAKRASKVETWVQEMQCEVAADKRSGRSATVDQLAWRVELDAANMADKGLLTVGQMDKIQNDADKWANPE